MKGLRMWFRVRAEQGEARRCWRLVLKTAQGSRGRLVPVRPGVCRKPCFGNDLRALRQDLEGGGSEGGRNQMEKGGWEDNGRGPREEGMCLREKWVGFPAGDRAVGCLGWNKSRDAGLSSPCWVGDQQ